MKQDSKIKLYEDRNSFFMDSFFYGGLSRRVLQHSGISFKAKGLFLLIEANQELFNDPTKNKKEFLLDHTKEGWDAVSSGIHELLEAGLLIKETHRNPGPGRKYIIGVSWHLTAGDLEDVLIEEDREWLERLAAQKHANNINREGI
jgi:hypothetical protein